MKIPIHYFVYRFAKLVTMVKNVFLVLCYLFLAVCTRAQYTIPGATQQPAWVFPIWIENGAGEKDTLYLGYDTTASTIGVDPSDSIFGVKVSIIDTNTFNASWATILGWPGNYSDTAYKVLVCNGMTGLPNQNYGTIWFMHATYPLKISWDVSLLQSDSLPFIEQGNAPRAQCELSYSMPVYGDAYLNGNRLYCGAGPLLITDSVQIAAGSCYAKDSVYFKDIFNTGGAIPEYIQPFIKTWSGIVVGTKEPELESDILNIYPNPNEGTFYITLKESIKGNLRIEIENTLGQIILSNNILLNGIETDIPITIENRQTGLYFISATINQIHLNRRIILIKN